MEVKFHYTLTLNEQVVQTSEGQQPLACTHGSGGIIRGLAAELEGMKEEEEKSLFVSAENAYGKVGPNAFKELPKSSPAEGLEPQKDRMLQANSPEGQQIMVRISDVNEDSIVLDLNHPLAGKDLKFEVKAVSVE